MGIAVRVLAVAGLAALALASPSAAARGVRPPAGLTYVRVAGGGEVGGPVAFSVWRIAADGKRQRLLTGAGPLQWSPDGERFLFTRLGRGGYSLYVAAADGGSVRRVAGGTSTGSWLGASGEVVYSRPAGGGRYAVYRTDPGTGAAPQRLFVLPGVPVWSPDGRSLVYPADGVLILAAADGSDPRPLARGDSLVSWSPRGTEVAYTRGEAICVTRIASRATHCFTPGGGGAAPTWSADGSRLVYSRGDGFAIASARPDGSDRRDLLTIGSPAVRFETPAWQPAA